MTVIEATHQPIFVSRQRERRRSVGSLLSALSKSLGDCDDVPPLRSVFEDTLRRVLPGHVVHLREQGSRWSCAVRSGSARQSVTFEIPGPVPRFALETTCDTCSPLGEWDVQALSMAADVGALVLAIERTQTRLGRAGLGPAQKHVSDGAVPLLGSTRAMKELRSQIERVSETDFTVLLEGESGVGKELVARQIHELSRRRDGPFVALNCAALVETLLEAELFGIEEKIATGVRGRRGKFEHADGGTLFLDEVSDLSLVAQAKLLRAIQDLSVERVGGQGARRVDIRIVAATNRGLGSLVGSKLFRPDLFYRLSGVDIRVPTLRERRDDIPELAASFLKRHHAARPLRLSSTAIDALLDYAWPGNVRELERLIERAVALTESDVIELNDLPPGVRGEFIAVLAPALERNDTMRAWGSRYARLVLDRCRGNKRAASRVLGISYHTLNAYLQYPRKPTPSTAEHEWVKNKTGEEARTHTL